MQKAFASTVPKPAEAVYTEQAWSGSDSNAAAMSVGTSLTPLLEGAHCSQRAPVDASLMYLQARHMPQMIGHQETQCKQLAAM